jgi:MoaA/NifB/PqqE/SkfB family radical SAM enzyme
VSFGPDVFRKALPKVRGGAGLLRARFSGRRAPLVVGWAVTYRCNLRCGYCERWREPGRELDTAAALRLIDELAAAGTVALSLTGGEPLLRRDIGSLIDRAVGRGLYVSLNTNGGPVERRKEALAGLSRLTVSLEGPRDIHDAVRGGGAFDRAVRAVEIARFLGLETQLNATVNRENQERVPEILALARDLGTRVAFQPATAGALGDDDVANPLACDAAAYRRALAVIRGERRRGRDSVVANSRGCLAHLSRWPEDAPLDCAGGIIGCRIEPDGDVFHCGRVRVERPDQNAPASGVEAAFRSLPPTACAQCWCAPRVELNLRAGLAPGALVDLLR